MVDGMHRFLDRETAEARAKRPATADRDRLRKIIGAVDPRADLKALIYDATTAQPSLAGRGAGYRIHAVRWPVLDGLDAEGLLLQPDGAPTARVVALPDADISPEQLAGLAPGLDPAAQFARRLAQSGCQVLVPVAIDRKDTWSGIPGIRMTNLPHREWIYRMAFEAGRHIIGYEVQQALAAVDWFTHENAARRVPIAVAGNGEGGLVALYSAALDTRIEAALVSGYFQPREEVWKEPVYRDVWGLVREAGDAGIADLVAPRKLIIEASRYPRIDGPPPKTNDRGGATPNGTLSAPAPDAVRREAARARSKPPLIEGDALPTFAMAIGVTLREGAIPENLRPSFDPSERVHRQFDRQVAFTQKILAASLAKRAAFWSKADASSPERWKASVKPQRDYIWSEVIGRLPDPAGPVNPRTRQVYETEKFRGYEVTLDVWPDVFAYGILLVPKNLRPGERRPVVVCQHGLEGRPQEVADPNIDSHYYHRYGARLAEEGFIVYAPQNPYIGQDRFRLLQRKAHPLKLSLFSFILGQHQRTLEWLSTLAFVDPARIGFYGLSYGGKTAVRVPPLLEQYALSICSADFNEWVWKNTRIDSRYSYLLTGEYDMIEFDFANVVNYSDLANLMAPRPFMVERGHADGVAPDEWVAYEFAKVRRFYTANLKLPDNAAIEFFNGPHTINGKGSFAFLRKHLNWPQ
jgi:dienelactone hydrolase